LKKTYLIVRIGDAKGDVVVITPLIRYLKSLGHSVKVLTGACGREILHSDPFVDKIIEYRRNTVPLNALSDFFKKVAKEEGCDEIVDLCGSVESRIIFTANQPEYNYPKNERRAIAEKNMYEETFRIAGIDPINLSSADLRPHVFLTDQEELSNQRFRLPHLGRKKVVWALAGSSIHKAFPYVRDVIEDVVKINKWVQFFTVGGPECEILELALVHPNVTLCSGKFSFRESMAMVKNADLVIAPETGLLHVAGCFKMPKIAIFSHTTHEVFTKHFLNCTPIEPKVNCAPCFRFIQYPELECPIDPLTHAPACMGAGIIPDRITKAIVESLNLNVERIVYA